MQTSYRVSFNADETKIITKPLIGWSSPLRALVGGRNDEYFIYIFHTSDLWMLRRVAYLQSLRLISQRRHRTFGPLDSDSLPAFL